MKVAFLLMLAPSDVTNSRCALGDGSRQSYVCAKPSLRGGRDSHLMCHELRK